MNVTSGTYNPFGMVNTAAGSAGAFSRPDAVKPPSPLEDSPEQTGPAARAGEHQAGSEEASARDDSHARQPAADSLDQLTPEERRIVEQLKQIDSEVRNHEMAHVAAGGAYITSGASFTYKKGPDGQNYAVAGEVSIDTSPVPGDPEATMRKMAQIRRAALAPADPSAQDQRVAANAASESLKALSELNLLRAEQMAEQREAQAFGPSGQEAADTYARVGTLPESDTRTFDLAV